MMRQVKLGAALFLSAAGALALEIVAGRLLAPYAGMSLYSWTSIIAVVLAGLSAGHWLGGRMAGPGVAAQRLERRLALAFLAASLATLAVLLLLRLLAGPLLGSGLAPIPALLLLAMALFFLPSLFAGLVSPALSKLALDAGPEGGSGRVLGRMYALGALGSIFGTLAAGLLLLSWLGSTATVIGTALLYAALGLLFLRRPVLAPLAAFAGLLAGLGAWGAKLQAFASPCRIESGYFCLRIADFSPESGRESAVLVLDHLGHGINDRLEPRLLYSPYLHLADELASLRFGREAISAFFIGGGAYTLPRAWLETYAKPDLRVAEIDPAVTKAAQEHLWLDLKPGLVIDHRDARVALAALPPRPHFDVVFGDAFHDIGIPAHLVTREFHREIARRLKPGGFYAINVIESRREPKFLLALLATLRQDFASVEAWLDQEEYAEGTRVTYLVIASDRPSPADNLQARHGVERSWVRLGGRELGDLASGPILTDDLAPVDRLMAHVLLKAELAER
jgi:MFS family permease